MKHSRRILTLAFCCLFLFSPLTHSRLAFQSLDPGRNVALPDWSNSGDIIINVDFCTVSTSGNGPNASAAPYQIRISNRQLPPPTGPFIMENMADPTQTVPVSFVFYDLAGGGATETAIPYVYTAQDKTGALNQCPSGNNSRYVMTMLAADLNAVYAGTYRGKFEVEARGGNGGNETKTSFFQVNLAILDLVMISGLQDIIFPPYFGGGGNLVEGYSLCVYRNSPNPYQITASGDGAGGAFTLTNGVDVLPYLPEWNDGTGFSTLNAGTALTGQTNVNTTSTDCALYTANNADLQVTLLGADMDLVPDGIYSGTMTLIIAPL